MQYYGVIIRDEGAEVEIIIANDCRKILKYTKNVLNCDIHSRARTKKILRACGAEKVCGLDDILNESVNGSGYNTNYGLLGSNKSTESSVKLFPRECTDLVMDIQKEILDRVGKHVEVMVYGDGAFKDPVGKIWELADPCVSPASTPGLDGTPNEVKLKYLADNDFKDLSGEELKKAIENRIRENCRVYIDAMRKYMGEGSRPIFASKSCCFKRIYAIVADMGMGTDIVSPGELYTANAAGFPMENAFFHGNNKTDADIEYAMETGRSEEHTSELQSQR